MADNYLTEAQKKYKREYYKNQRNILKGARAEQHVRDILELVNTSDDATIVASLREYILNNFRFRYK